MDGETGTVQGGRDYLPSGLLFRIRPVLEGLSVDLAAVDRDLGLVILLIASAAFIMQLIREHL
jgi:hypothetical protein